MAHAERRINNARIKIPDNPRKGAVLILLYETNNTLRFPLIIRPLYDGVHSGQISLPGGSYEEGDGSLEYTSVRETEEETGVSGVNIEIIGCLSDLYIPPSNFLVKPFIGIHETKPVFIPHSREVARIVEMDVEKIMDETLIREKQIQMSNGISVTSPYYDIDGLVVWGATAMILSELKSILFETGF